EAAEAVEHRVDLGDDVLPVDEDPRVARGAQRRVQRGAVLGRVQLLAGEHGADASTQPRLLGEPQEQAQGLLRHEVLRVVEEDAAGLAGELRAAPPVVREEPAQLHAADSGAVRGEVLPGGETGGSAHAASSDGDGRAPVYRLQAPAAAA